MIQTPLPQTSGLYVQNEDWQTAGQPLAFPLKHTEVNAQVSGSLSRVEVIQTFENPFTTPIEATYVFPLPDEAAVDTMVVRLGDRTIQGRIEKREDAQAIYDRAKQQGQTAGLLEQERANLFTQSLANIKPGEQIEVVIGYSDQLAYKQGTYEFVFPMVVGPRYIPGTPIAGGPRGSAAEPMALNQDTDQVPDASRLNGPMLPADQRSGHDIQLTVEIEAGSCPLDSANLASPSHQIAIAPQSNGLRVTLAPSDTLPNKDFILRYQVAVTTTQTALLTQADKRGGHFAAYLIPALRYDETQYIPKDMVFLIDTSGSQAGAPLAQCQALMRRFIEGLHPQDTFNVVNFANTTQKLATVPLENTPRNCNRALNYVDRLRAGGGTEMLRGLKTVLNLPQLETERIRNIVLLTDGYIGNETQIFAEVQRSLTLSTRLHSFGAGSSVNRFLLNRVADMGRGISHVIRHDAGIEKVVDRFLGQINNPVLGNLALHWDGPGEAPVLYPTAPPDLFAEQPLMVLGRKGDRQPGTLRITGITADGQPFEQAFSVGFEASGNPALAQLWGRAQIKALMNEMVSGETTGGVAAVTETALAYQLLSQYTAFVAVSDDVRVEQPSESVAVNMPVMMPEAISYGGIYGTTAVGQPPRARRMVQSAAPEIVLKSKPTERFKRRAAPAIGRAAPMPATPGEVADPGGLGDVTELDSVLDLGSTDFATRAAIEGVGKAELIPSQPLGQRIEIVKAEGLKARFLKQLQQAMDNHWSSSSPPAKGVVIFELIIQQGRVRRVMLDAEASDDQDPDVIDLLRQIFFQWRCPQTFAAPLRVELQVR